MSTSRQLLGQRVIVVGGGGQGKSIATILADMGATVIGFLDDSPDLQGTQVMGLPVLGGHQEILKLNVDGAILAIGSNAVRYRIYERLVSWGVTMVNAIHPTAYIAPSAQIGQGVVVKYFGVVDAAATVGNNVIVGMHTMVAHDAQVGSHAHVSAGSRICGHVCIQEGAFVAVNATIVPATTVGAWSTVGANAVVNKDLAPNVTAVGAPARVIKRHPDGWYLG